jgi:hypothetical protein
MSEDLFSILHELKSFVQEADDLFNIKAKDLSFEEIISKGKSCAKDLQAIIQDLKSCVAKLQKALESEVGEEYFNFKKEVRHLELKKIVFDDIQKLNSDLLMYCTIE